MLDFLNIKDNKKTRGLIPGLFRSVITNKY